MSCCNPTYIINPSYINSTHRFNRIFGYSVPYYQSNGNFDFRYFSARARRINHDNYKNYFAMDEETGDVINIYLQVPCNKCSACRCSKQFNLRNRMILEQYGRETPMYFVTLTYNNEHLPEDGVSVRDCQLFFKRFRERLSKQFNYNVPFRYTLFSEYGSRRKRPHYHFLLYGFDADKLGFNNILEFESWMAKTAWQNGFVYIMLCNPGCFNYVSKYVLKSSNVPKGKNKNFNLASRGNGGLGCPALSQPDIIKQIFTDGCTSIRVNLYGRQFDFPIPKQILAYKYKYNLQSLRSKYLKTVRQYFHMSSHLANLVSKYRFLNKPEVCLHIDEACKTFKSRFGIPLTSPTRVVEVAPYAPEFRFYRDSQTLRFESPEGVLEVISTCFSCMEELTKFNPKNLPVYISNSEKLSNFAARISLLVQTDIDFQKLTAAYDYKLNRMLIDDCRDNQ